MSLTTRMKLIASLKALLGQNFTNENFGHEWKHEKQFFLNILTLIYFFIFLLKLLTPFKL